MEASRDRLARLLDSLAGAELARRGKRSDELQRAALDFEEVERLPLVVSWPQGGDSRFPPLPNSSIYADPAAMLYSELVSAFDLSISGRAVPGSPGDDLAPTIRPNWGTVIVASLLGGIPEQSGEHTPWIRRSEDRPLSLEAIAEAEPEIATSGWVPRVLAAYEAYREFLAPYPELASALRITLPDLQGPLDSVEMLCGAELFVELIDRPELAARAFRRAAELQVACARLFAPYTSDGPKASTHQHGFLVKGKILIRCDSAVMISAELYRDLVAPADEFVLSSLGGGGIHSCGRIGHAVPEMLCLDFGQSFMNDVDSLYAFALKRRIPFLRVQPGREELADASILDRFPTGVSLFFQAESLEDARTTLEAYLAACARRAGRG
jgi:hypothetical protein